jgi:hypothetical protein
MADIARLHNAEQDEKLPFRLRVILILIVVSVNVPI